MNARNRRRQIQHDDFSIPSMPLSEADEALFGAIAAADSQLATIGNDGRIQIGVFTMTPTGLVAGGQATFEEWQRVGDVLRRLDASIQWLIGDWFAYGERVWGQTYEQVSEATGYEVKTLYDYAYVAKNVDFSVRTEKLTFGHHKLVAGLEPDEQRQWLEYAANNSLTISQLRQGMALNSPTHQCNPRGGGRCFRRRSSVISLNSSALESKQGRGIAAPVKRCYPKLSSIGAGSMRLSALSAASRKDSPFNLTAGCRTRISSPHGSSVTPSALTSTRFFQRRAAPGLRPHVPGLPSRLS